MSATKILWGQITIVFLIILATHDTKRPIQGTLKGMPHCYTNRHRHYCKHNTKKSCYNNSPEISPPAESKTKSNGNSKAKYTCWHCIIEMNC